MPPRILIVGAMGAETSPLLAALRRPQPVSSRLIRGTLGGVPVSVLTCGIGPSKAARRLLEADLRPNLIVSIGTAGALHDELTIGEVVTAHTLHEGERCCTPPPLPWPGVARAVSLVTVDRPVWSRPARQRLAGQGHVACEMEAGALHRASATWGAQLTALKVISDHAGGRDDDPQGRPSLAELARFKARALALCTAHLLPALRDGLRQL